MLQHLLIRNIAIADNIDVDWSAGMTSISGETGAGKSVLLNSLNLALGDRADSNIVRHGEKRAEVVATFNIQRIKIASKWLSERDLDIGSECILRRTVSSDGRSRAFINGQPVPLNELKALGELLIDIHSQHAHQSLMRPETHMRLLDEYAGQSELKKRVKDAWLSWQGLERKYQSLKNQAEEKAARVQLLQYQCEELAKLELEDGETEKLETEFQRMHKSEQLLAGAHSAKSCIESDQEDGALVLLKQALNQLRKLDDTSEPLDSASAMLESAVIQLEESSQDLDQYIDSFDFDEARRFFVEERLNTIHELARKHSVLSTDLPAHYLIVQTELDSLKLDEASMGSLEDDVSARKQVYLQFAGKLSTVRKKKAVAFEKEVVEKLQHLAMPGAMFEVAFTDLEVPSPNGLEQANYQICLNPGQPLQPLAKVASGGELSRVSLAIAVVCAEHSTIPTLVFDEVDVGISGATAEIVGHMLRSVGAQGQVICVTHLPQVAALGHNHSIVQKTQSADSTTTNIMTLNSNQRIDEVARMLGGIDITAQTRAHAEEMLRSQARAH